MLKILTAPNPSLTTPSRSVSKIDKKIKKLVIEMEETLTAQQDPQGVGLAAPQVGIGFALFIIKPTPSAETNVFINPKILQQTGPALAPPARARHLRVAGIPPLGHPSAKKTGEKMEGCLSIPRIWAYLKRSPKVQIEYQDSDGKKHIEWFSGIKAVIVQHEIDHLRGVLFTQRCLEQKVPLYEEKGDKLVKIKNV